MQRFIRIQVCFVIFVGIFAEALLSAAALESMPNDPYFAKFKLIKAPQTKRLLLEKGDRLAICGDSITEQKMYSRIMETYLTVCVPELDVTVRQYGWSGEKTAGFVDRMKNDCLRFKPTIATTCYGMNDHEYKPFLPRIGKRYRTESEFMVEQFKANGCRVVLGSPGCVGKMPFWVISAAGTVQDLNLNLCELRNIGINVAREEHVAFADVFRPMLITTYEGKKKYGPDYEIPGNDGVHPGWAGQLVMAYAFLKALGLNGDVGTIAVNLSGKNPARASMGHQFLSASANELRIRSSRYAFCSTNTAVTDGTNGTLRSALALVPFNEELNRFVLVAHNGTAESYKVTWGEQARIYSAKDLARGVNLAQDFVVNPFWEAFHKVDEAVAAKQAYETKQIKEAFRSLAARSDLAAVVNKTEAERAKLAEEIRKSFVPVEHTLRIERN
jgi:hypothetical protein